MPNVQDATFSDCSDSQKGTECNAGKAREHENSDGGDIPNLCPPEMPSCMCNCLNAVKLRFCLYLRQIGRH